jgi:hypothetical protein
MYPSPEEIEANARLVARTYFSLGYKYLESFVKKPNLTGRDDDAKKLIDLIYEQQMLQAIDYLTSEEYFNGLYELVIVKGNTIVDFYGRRTISRDIIDIEDSDDFAYALFLTVAYLYDLHKSKKVFHGDIKPKNIFFA